VRYIAHREEGLTDGRRRELFGIAERYRALRGDEPAIRGALRDDARGLRNSQLELFGRVRRAVRVAPEIALARQWLRFGWRGTRWERSPEKAARRAALRLASKAMPRGLREALWAPRGQYRNASQLARAASVSVMSAFRFIRQCGREGYLHESAAYLRLVRREDLFRRWQALSVRSRREVPMRFLLPGDSQAQLRRMLDSGRACLALFAAAEELRLGFVGGVPPYVYVQRIQASNLSAWENLRPCSPGEPLNLIVREAPAVQSVFRGLVRPQGLAACDVLQIWLDVASHPSRGQEQADMIRKRVLHRVIEAGP
jgi:hypothetical protein